jgi:hypothetical protein
MGLPVEHLNTIGPVDGSARSRRLPMQQSVDATLPAQVLEFEEYSLSTSERMIP